VFGLALCEGETPSVVVEFILVIVVSELLKVELVAEDSSNATEA
jgi:hypothetical protein